MHSCVNSIGRLASLATVIVIVLSSSRQLLAQPRLSIAEPTELSVVDAGDVLTVVVNASPPDAFKQVVIIIGRWGFSQVLTEPPYRFSFKVPLHIGPVTLRATGYTEPGRGATSEPVTVLAERADVPTALRSEPSVLVFDRPGDQTSLRIVGIFRNEPPVELNESTFLRWVIDDVAVATVMKDAVIVTAVKPGSTRLKVTYRNISVFVPVTVGKPRMRK